MIILISGPPVTTHELNVLGTLSLDAFALWLEQNSVLRDEVIV
jgi:hypothetical protein